jgi:hypothetical protein
MSKLTELLSKLGLSNEISAKDFPTLKWRQIKSVSDTYTITESDDVVICTGSGKTLTLPPVANCSGKVITVINNASSGTTTVDGNASETINGSANVALDARYESVTLLSNGTLWFITAFRGLA